jgi:hypothetical protein
MLVAISTPTTFSHPDRSSRLHHTLAKTPITPSGDELTRPIYEARSFGAEKIVGQWLVPFFAARGSELVHALEEWDR